MQPNQLTTPLLVKQTKKVVEEKKSNFNGPPEGTPEYWEMKVEFQDDAIKNLDVEIAKSKELINQGQKFQQVQVLALQREKVERLIHKKKYLENLNKTKDVRRVYEEAKKLYVATRDAYQQFLKAYKNPDDRKHHTCLSALMGIANLYQKGCGKKYPPDLQKAIAYYKEADNGGKPEAKGHIEKIEKELLQTKSKTKPGEDMPKNDNGTKSSKVQPEQKVVLIDKDKKAQEICRDIYMILSNLASENVKDEDQLKELEKDKSKGIYKLFHELLDLYPNDKPMVGKKLSNFWLTDNSGMEDNLFHKTCAHPQFLRYMLRNAEGLEYTVRCQYNGNTVFHQLADLPTSLAEASLKELLSFPKLLSEANKKNTHNPKDKVEKVDKTPFGYFIGKSCFSLAEQILLVLLKTPGKVNPKDEIPLLSDAETETKKNLDLCNDTEYLKKSPGYLVVLRLRVTLDPAYRQTYEEKVTQCRIKRTRLLNKDYKRALDGRELNDKVLVNKIRLETSSQGVAQYEAAKANATKVTKKVEEEKLRLMGELREINVKVVNDSKNLSGEFNLLKSELDSVDPEVNRELQAIWSSHERQIPLRKIFNVIVKFFSDELQREFKLAAFLKHGVLSILEGKKQEILRLDVEYKTAQETFDFAVKQEDELKDKLKKTHGNQYYRNQECKEELSKAESKKKEAEQVETNLKEKLEHVEKVFSETNKIQQELKPYYQLFINNLRFKVLLLRTMSDSILKAHVKDKEMKQAEANRAELKAEYLKLCEEATRYSQGEMRSGFPDLDSEPKGSLEEVAQQMLQFSQVVLNLDEEQKKLDAAIKQKTNPKEIIAETRQIILYWFAAVQLSIKAKFAKPEFVPKHIKQASLDTKINPEVKEFIETLYHARKGKRKYTPQLVLHFIRSMRWKFVLPPNASKHAAVLKAAHTGLEDKLFDLQPIDPTQPHSHQRITLLLTNYLEEKAKSMGYKPEDAKISLKSSSSVNPIKEPGESNKTESKNEINFPVCSLLDGRKIEIRAEEKVDADGNCAFRAVLGKGHPKYDSKDANIFERAGAIEFLKDHLKDEEIKQLIARDVQDKYRQYILGDLVNDKRLPESLKTKFEEFKQASQKPSDNAQRTKMEEAITKFCCEKATLETYLDQYLSSSDRWPHAQGSLAAFAQLLGIRLHLIQKNTDGTYDKTEVEIKQTFALEPKEEVFLVQNASRTHFDRLQVTFVEKTRLAAKIAALQSGVLRSRGMTRDRGTTFLQVQNATPSNVVEAKVTPKV